MVSSKGLSSPRPWGCFPKTYYKKELHFVFPTPVGVFLFIGAYLASGSGLPHARGGVSEVKPPRRRPIWSSPRPWGCFFSKGRFKDRALVFPTPVGVFPGGQCCLMLIRGLPHARGGVSNAMNLTTRELQSSPRPWGCFQD